MKRPRTNEKLRRIMTQGWMPWVEDTLLNDAETQRRIQIKDQAEKPKK